jgi:hypothetical protein
MLCMVCISEFFLVFIYVWFLILLLAFQQAQVHQKREFVRTFYLVLILEVLPSLRFRRSHTSLLLVFNIFLLFQIVSVIDERILIGD